MTPVLKLPDSVLMNVKKWISVIVTLGVFVGVGVFFFNRKKPIETPPFQFHPDSVVGFELTGNQISAKFNRKNRSEPWQSEQGGGSESIQQILNLLASTPSVKGSSRSGKLSLKLTFSDSQEWSGGFDGKDFFWKTGALTQQKLVFNESLSGYLSQGRFFRDSKTFNWCTSRPQKIFFKSNDIEFEVFKEGVTWMSRTNKKLNPTEVELWLSQFCEVKVDYFRDAELFGDPTGKESGKFQVVFEDSSESSFEKIGSQWLISSEKGFSSRHWEEGIFKLFKMN